MSRGVATKTSPVDIPEWEHRLRREHALAMPTVGPILIAALRARKTIRVFPHIPYSSAVHSAAKSIARDGLNARHTIWAAPIATVAMISKVRMPCILLRVGGCVIV